MSVLMALMENCKLANATSNSAAVVFTEYDVPEAALERRKPVKRRRKSLYSLDLMICKPL